MLALALYGASSCAEGQEPVRITHAEVGLGGLYKAGHWTQLLLRLTANEALAGHLEVVCHDPDGAPAVYLQEGGILHLPAGKELAVRAYFLMSTGRSQVAVRLKQAGQVLWSQPLELPPPATSTSELFLGVGAIPHFPEAMKLLRRPAEAPLRYVQVEQAAALPDRWWGYGGFEHALLLGSQGGLLDQLTPAQAEALRQWTLLGGRLVFACAQEAQRRFGEQEPWRRMAPGTFLELAPLREAAGLATYTRVEFPALRTMPDAERPRVARWAPSAAAAAPPRTVIDQGGLAAGTPLAVRSAYGVGLLTHLALDLDQPALAAWPGQPRLIANLLEREARTASAAEVRLSRVGQLGYTDLTGQLRAALEQFPGVTIVNFTAVALLAAVYLLLIGPLEFFAVQQGWLPRTWAWGWFVLCTLVFSLLAWRLGVGAHGDRAQLNQVELVDIDLTERIVRGSEWLHVYTPAAQRGDLRLAIASSRVAAGPAQGWLAWQGLPGDGLGGLETRQTTLSPGAEYEVAAPSGVLSLRGLAQETASSKPLAAQWWAALPEEPATPLALSPYGLLAGEVQNPLPVELTDCWLVYDEWLYRLETLPPRGRTALSSLAARNLEAVLTKRTVVDTKDLSTVWDPAATDTPRIMQLLLFHDAARGSAYTGLSHRYQPQLDWSHLIRSGRAALVGRLAEPLAELEGVWRRAGSAEPGAAPAPARHAHSWVRISIPVRKAATQAPPPPGATDRAPLRSPFAQPTAP